MAISRRRKITAAVAVIVLAAATFGSVALYNTLSPLLHLKSSLENTVATPPAQLAGQMRIDLTRVSASIDFTLQQSAELAQGHFDITPTGGSLPPFGVDAITTRDGGTLYVRVSNLGDVLSNTLGSIPFVDTSSLLAPFLNVVSQRYVRFEFSNEQPALAELPGFDLSPCLATIQGIPQREADLTRIVKIVQDQAARGLSVRERHLINDELSRKVDLTITHDQVGKISGDIRGLSMSRDLAQACGASAGYGDRVVSWLGGTLGQAFAAQQYSVSMYSGEDTDRVNRVDLEVSSPDFALEGEMVANYTPATLTAPSDSVSAKDAIDAIPAFVRRFVMN